MMESKKSDMLLELFEKIVPDLIRYPSIVATTLRLKVERFILSLTK